MHSQTPHAQVDDNSKKTLCCHVPQPTGLSAFPVAAPVCCRLSQLHRHFSLSDDNSVQTLLTQLLLLTM